VEITTFSLVSDGFEIDPKGVFVLGEWLSGPGPTGARGHCLRCACLRERRRTILGSPRESVKSVRAGTVLGQSGSETLRVFPSTQPFEIGIGLLLGHLT